MAHDLKKSDSSINLKQFQVAFRPQLSQGKSKTKIWANHKFDEILRLQQPLIEHHETFSDSQENPSAQKDEMRSNRFFDLTEAMSSEIEVEVLKGQETNNAFS